MEKYSFSYWHNIWSGHQVLPDREIYLCQNYPWKTVSEAIMCETRGPTGMQYVLSISMCYTVL